MYTYMCIPRLSSDKKKSACQYRRQNQETGVLSLGWEDPLEEQTATYSSILAWKTPWTEEAWWGKIPRITKVLDTT